MTDRTVAWHEAEPDRLARDQADMAEHFPSFELDLTEGQGVWRGRLPAWPFDRPEPEGLAALLEPHGGLKVELAYVAAYPMVFPYVVPVDPRPSFETWTQARWHVLGNGALCLFQTVADWDPTSHVTDLLYRAAAWHVEFALLTRGAVDAMTLQGIVNDDSLDSLITEIALAPPDGTGEG